MFERATREWRTSPTIATCSPSMRELLVQRVEVEQRLGRDAGAFRRRRSRRARPSSARRVAARRSRRGGSRSRPGRSAERDRGVLERLALVDGRAGGLERHRVGRKPLRRSSKLELVRVDDSKKRLRTRRPRSVGSFFISRSSERSKLRAVPSSRSTSSRVRSAIESRCRRGGGFGEVLLPHHFQLSQGCPPPLRAWVQQDAVDLVHLEELHLDVLAARGRRFFGDGRIGLAMARSTRQAAGRARGRP